MSKTLVIVESPVKAAKIQEYLGVDYKVIASMGHIADLGRGGSNNIGVDIDKQFKPRYVIIEDKIKTLSNIFHEAENSDLILLASDGDREGEAIAWHLFSRLKDFNKPIKRMVFNEIKKKTILQAVENVRDINYNLFDAQETRRILDRIVGFMASPFLMTTMEKTLSAGRVQSVVTRMIVDREDEINKFIPEEFWTIGADALTSKNEQFELKYNGRPTNKNQSDLVVNAVSGNSFVVSDVVRKTELVPAPPPLVTSTLQRLMSKSFGMSADKTMKAAQALYEAGYCSYIRTDSVRCSDEALAEVRDYIKDNFILPKKPNIFSNKNDSQDAHECVRPTDLSLKYGNTFLIPDPDQAKVYEMIWKYFVASQMEPAKYDTLKVSCHLNTDKKIIFKASGKCLISKGYMEVLGVNDNSTIDIPNLNVGDVLSINNIIPLQKKTTPPSRFSEDKLIKELEQKNIGRPATYAELLTKINSRNYVEKKGSVFYPTDLGKEVTEKLKTYFNFMDYNYTANLEKKLDKVEDGSISKLEVLTSFYSEFKKQLTDAYIKNNVDLCEKCGSKTMKMVNKNTNESFLSCSNYKYCY